MTPHLLLFDLYSGGHHHQYIRQVADYWVRQGVTGRLDIVVPASFLEVHPALATFGAAHAGAGVRVIPIRDEVRIRPGAGTLQLLRNDLEHGRLLRHYVEKLQPSHCVLMYFDHVQFSLALDLRFPRPVAFSGIYFRPSFHYSSLQGRPSSLKERLQRLRKVLVLRAALRNPHFTHLFCLDPYVVPHVAALHGHAAPVFLPDGIEPAPTGDVDETTLRARRAVEPGRRTALLFGALAYRKGLFHVLEAGRLLPPEAQRRLCLCFVGHVEPAERDRFYDEVHALQAETAVQVVVEDRFIPDEAVQPLLRSADLVLLAYQHHIGSSGVLIRAAAEAVPVLGSDYGLVGEHIRRRRLGLAVDTTSPEAIARGLEAWLSGGQLPGFSGEEARRFAAENTADRFAATILRHTGVPAETIPDLP